VDGPGSTSLCNITYTDTSTGKLRVCPTRVGDASYRDVWGAFLPALVRHLKQHGWLNRTYIGFDEKPQTIMNGIFSVLKADAPELKVSLAGGSSSRESGSVGDLVLYYGELSHPATVRRLLEQRRGVGPTTFYTACGVPTPNTYLYSPQWESRLLPWIAFQYGLSGYTRWAYQSWPRNVWRRPVIRWHSGESFLVYPGEDGPIDSTRWELLRQGIEDHEALEMLQQKINALRKIPGRAEEAANLQRRMMRDVRLATYVETCRGVPDPALSRHDINGLLRHVEGRPILGYVNDNRIISTFSPKDFMPDANLQKAVWKNAKWVHVEHDMNGKKLEPQSAMDIATVWTPHYIYFAYHCKYTTLNIFKDADPNAEKFGLWDRDVVEAFINPQPERINHYYEFEISPNNLWVDLEINWAQPPATDADWDSHLDHATHIDPKTHTWNAEFRIPVASMGVKELYAGAEWRLNMFRCDGPGEGQQRRYLSWAVVPHGRSFHQPTAFGIVQFVK
jgi:Glycoside hydrolase 123, catalytic domain/Carbohydrate family 9 binding domain-like